MNAHKIAVILALTTLFAGLASAQGASSSLEMEVLQTEPVPLQAGEYADVWIRVTNTGDAKAQDPTFEVLDNYPFTPTDRTEWSPRGGLERGESYDMRVQVRVDENAVFGENELNIRKSSSGGSTTITESIPLEVRVDDRSLIVQDLHFPERVEPGSSGEMTLTLENLANSNFRNIDVSLDTSELPISTRETSRKRISSIGHGETNEASFMIDVDDDADNELHDLPITIDYRDQAGNELTMTETTGINIGGFPNIDVAVEQTDIRTSGRGEMTFRIINKGEGQARFTEVSLEDSDQYEILSEDSIYLGSMIADDFQTAEFDLYVEEDETLEMPVTVEYRDGNGDQEYSTTVERQLYTSDQLRQYGLSQGGSSWILILLILGLVAGGAVYWRRRKNKE